MRRVHLFVLAGLCLSLLGLTARGAEQPAASCGSFGTAVTFLESPQAAADKAKKEEKLVFVLHVSGNFETAEFT